MKQVGGFCLVLFIAGIAIAVAASLVLLSAIMATGTTPTDWFGIGTVPTAEPIVIEAPTPAPTFTPTPEPPAVLPQPTYTPRPTQEPVVPEVDNMCLVWDDIRLERARWISPGIEYRVVVDIQAITMVEGPEGAPDIHYGSGTIVLEQGQEILVSVFKYDGPFEVGTTYDLRVTWWQTIPPIGGTDVYGVHDVIDAWPSRPKEDLRGDTDASSA